LRVRTTRLADDGYTANRLSACVTLNGSEWVATDENEVPFDVGYHEFGAALIHGRNELIAGHPAEKVKKRILECIRPLKLQYEPVENFTCCLFSAATSKEIVARLENVLRSLHDALVVVKKIRPTIEKKLLNEVYVNTCADLPNALQFKLLRGRIPYGELKDTEAAIYGLASSSEKPLMENTTSPEIIRGKQSNRKEGDNNMLLSVTDEEVNTYHRDFLREAAAFKKQLPRLLTQFPNEYVAIFQEEVIDHSTSWDELAKITQQRFPDKFVLLEQVVPPSNVVVHMDAIET